MSYMFSNCTSLTDVNLKSFNTSVVTDMSSMFESCIEMSSLDLSSFNTQKCKKFNNMFANTNKSITVSVNSKISSNMIEAIKEYVIIKEL